MKPILGPGLSASEVSGSGLPKEHLSAAEFARVKEANTLCVNTISLMELVSLQDGVHMLEHPGDPGEHPFPSLFDTQLMKAQNYLYSELQLPELEIPEIPENTEENPSNNSETNSGQDNRRPFKRPKKRQSSE